MATTSFEGSEGIALARVHRVEGILSVGGGSVLDSSKAIAAGVCPLAMSGICLSARPPLKQRFIVSILTLAATGSEMNPSAVMTNDETKEKFFCLGSAAVSVSIVNRKPSCKACRATISFIRHQTSLPADRGVFHRDRASEAAIAAGRSAHQHGHRDNGGLACRSCRLCGSRRLPGPRRR